MSSRAKILCVVDLSLAPDALRTIQESLDVSICAPEHEAVRKEITHCEALWTHMNLQVDADLIEHAPRLRVVGTATTGTDHIDTSALAERGVRLLCIARDFGLLNRFTATAECAAMLMLACARNLRGAIQCALAGRWQGEEFAGCQLSGRTLGVVGLGRLGTMMCKIGSGLGMRVVGCDPAVNARSGVRLLGFEELLRQSDVVTLHVHLEEKTRHLFNAAAFAAMKPGALLINTSRGDLIDESALLAVLDSGSLGAFGADVLHDEWRSDICDSPLIAYAATHDNVVITPHIGGATEDSIRLAREFMAHKLVHYLETGQELTAS